MKRYTLSFAGAQAHRPDHPERTARKSGLNFDVTFQVWPNRAAMLCSIQMQARREPRVDDWRPCQREE